MIYLLIRAFEEQLKDWGLFGYVRVLTFVEFRAVLAMLLSAAAVLALGRPTILWLIKQKIGDQPEFGHGDLNELMKSKANTPTMGGILIIGALLAVVLLLGNMTNFYVIMAVVCVVWLAGVGIADDWLKLTTARRNPGSRQGLMSWEKLLFQLGLGLVLGIFIQHHGTNRTFEDLYDMSVMTHALNLPFFKTWLYDPQLGDFVPNPDVIVLGAWGFAILTIIVVTGSSNAVNLTDGMDGLASGVTMIVALAMLLLCLIAGTERYAKFLLVPYIPGSAELAVVMGAMVGACIGFLWFNCAPASVFMGDSGSLAIGGLLGFTAVVVRQEFLLLIIGGVFALEAISVILQVGYFRLSGGKRVFRCAPIHHHFHLAGWTEQQVVVRFWLISVVLTAVALATIKLR